MKEGEEEKANKKRNIAEARTRTHLLFLKSQALKPLDKGALPKTWLYLMPKVISARSCTDVYRMRVIK